MIQTTVQKCEKCGFSYSYPGLDCHKEEFRTYYIGKARDYKKRQLQTNADEYKKVRYEYTKKYREKNKLKRNARRRVEYLVSVGQIKKTLCVCGNRKVEAHHPDYSKPDYVQWLCRSCHRKIH